MSELGALSVRIEGETHNLDRALSRSERRLQNFGAVAATVAKRVATITSASIAAAGAIGVQMVRSTAAAADEMAKLSRRAGITVEDLGRLTHAANLSGVSQTELVSSMQRLAREIEGASTGTTRAAEAFRRLQIETRNADGSLRDQTVVMADLADRFSRMEDGALKTSLAQDIFGRSGANLITMLNAGSDGLRVMGDEAERLGLVFDSETAQAAERLNDNIARLQGRITGLARDFSGPIIRSLADFSDSVRARTEETAEFYAAIGRTGPIESAMHRIMQFIEDGIDGWRRYFFAQAGGQMRVNTLVDERNRLEDLIKVREAGAVAFGRETEADKQFIESRREKIREINREIGVLQDLAKARRMESEGEPLDVTVPFVPSPERVEEQVSEVAEVVATNYDAQLQRLREFVMSEEELEQERHRQRLDLLAEAFFEQQIGHEDQHQLLEDLEQAHASRMQAIRERGDQQRIAAERRVHQAITQMRNQAFNDAVGLLQLFAGESKAAAIAAIALNKGLMIAQTIQNTAAAQMRAYAELGPIAGPPAAAKIGVLGRIQAGIIAATGLKQAASVGRGGSASIAPAGGASGMMASGGGTAIAPADASRPLPAIATINITGDTFGRAQVAQMIEAINELSEDGVRLVVA